VTGYRPSKQLGLAHTHSSVNGIVWYTKGDDSTAQGNTKGWGHTNKLKQYKQIYKIQT